MDSNVMRLLWRCGLRPTTTSKDRPVWAVAIKAPDHRDEELRPISPSRIAIRNATKRLVRAKGIATARMIMRRYGMMNNLDEVPKLRWVELYWALENAALVPSSS